MGLAILLVAGLATYASLRQEGVQPRYDFLPGTATTTDAGDEQPKPEVEEPTTPPTIESGYGSVALALNQAASFPGSVSLRPLSIIEDSRCPMNARCVQAGRVIVSVRVRTSAGTASYEFEPGTTITTGAHTVTLLSVNPHTLAGQTITSTDYRFTFEVLQERKPGTGVEGRCYVGGCSSQLCTDTPNAVTTCEYRSEYACYATARCERQSSGECGWTETSELATCLANPPEEE